MNRGYLRLRMKTTPALFISYRRTHLPQLQRVKRFLEHVGIECFLDVETIDPLANFPDRIREAIGRSHALLAWWSSDYGDSDFCVQEFRIAWQHARRRSSDLVRRIWIVNPEERADHVCSGELDSTNFLKPPSAGGEAAWAEMLLQRIQGFNLIPEGTLADEREALPTPTLHAVPEKSREFTGRGPELMRIHGKLHPARMGDQGSAVAVQTHGLGGVGKTELAIAYARDFSQAYPGGVYWLNLAGWQFVGAAREEAAELAWLRALEQTFRLQPQILSLLTRDADGKQPTAMVVRERLAQHLGERSDYLWVLDNFPELSPLDVRTRILQFLRAPNGRGHTLLTTRDSRPADGFTAESLDVLSLEDALRLLAKFRPRQAREELPAMRELITEVGSHTQALMLLGEHARHEPGGYSEVLQRLKAVGSVRRIEEIADRLRDLLGAKVRGVVATFALSIEQLSDSSKEILSLASVCAPNVSIPEALLAQVFGPERADDFNPAMGAVLRASLLQRREVSSHGVFIHPLVAEATVSLLAVGTQLLRQRVADGLLDRVTNAREIRAHATMLEDLEQARTLGGKLEEQRGVHLLLRVGQFERARGQYAGARVAETQALQVARQVLGEEHPDTLSSMNNLAETLREQGDLGAARALHEQVLSIHRRVLGEEHPDTPRLMNNLALTLCAQGALGAARALHEQALPICRRVLGEEHPATLTSVNNLAETVRAQGDLGTARTLHEQALPIRRRVLGEEHPVTLYSMNNLGLTLRAQGDLGAARALHEQALSISRRMLGEKHPATSISMNNLALVLHMQGDLGAARALHEQALSICRHVVGEEHRDTLNSMNNLALTLYAQGDLGAARALHEQALLIRRRVLGEEHPDTTYSAWSLLSTLWEIGDKDTAARLFQSALLWLLERDPLSLGAEQRTIRGYVSETRQQVIG